VTGRLAFDILSDGAVKISIGQCMRNVLRSLYVL
jgi:hypothetical protein